MRARLVDPYKAFWIWQYMTYLTVLDYYRPLIIVSRGWLKLIVPRPSLHLLNDNLELNDDKKFLDIKFH